MTTAKARGKTDYTLIEWKAASLRKPSVVRLSRLDCLEHSILTYKLGKISEIDARNILQLWSSRIKPRF